MVKSIFLPILKHGFPVLLDECELSQNIWSASTTLCVDVGGKIWGRLPNFDFSSSNMKVDRYRNRFLIFIAGGLTRTKVCGDHLPFGTYMP